MILLVLLGSIRLIPYCVTVWIKSIDGDQGNWGYCYTMAKSHLSMPYNSKRVALRRTEISTFDIGVMAVLE